MVAVVVVVVVVLGRIPGVQYIWGIYESIRKHYALVIDVQAVAIFSCVTLGL